MSEYKEQLKPLCCIVAGSHLYGLNNADSDIDKRSVCMNIDSAYILGTKRFDQQTIQNRNEDSIEYEVRNFLHLAGKSNIHALEILFAPRDKFTFMTSEWLLNFDLHKNSLFDPHALFNCLRGYMKAEYRLAIGLRKGQIGGKRFEQVNKFGYSPKNMVQLFRLAHLGIECFVNKRVIVNLDNDHDQNFRQELLEIKNHPEKFKLSEMESRFYIAEKRLVEAYEENKHELGDYFRFDEGLANEILRSLYQKYICE